MKFIVFLGVFLSFYAESNESDDLEVIRVLGQNPLFSDHSAVSIIGSIQSISAQELLEHNAVSLSQHMKNQLASVHINDVQNNPFQPDVQYRGFTASPLLGLPQGLSVYLNGVRFNEPFGDTVNWDLIPLSALDNVGLYSGSNPSFGQNTLGGALDLRVKNGFVSDQSSLNLHLGSFEQQQVTVQSGGNQGSWGYYVIVNRLQEDGWRDFSSSELKQFLTTLTYKGEQHSVELLLSANQNLMTGNGAVPEQLMEIEGREAIYTFPDTTENTYHMAAINAELKLGKGLRLQANSYLRHNKIEAANGDDSDFETCEFNDAVTLCEEEAGILSQVEFVGFSADTLFTDISDIDPNAIDGTVNQSVTYNKSYGLAFQLLHNRRFKAFEHELVFGLGIDQANIHFVSKTELGLLNNESPKDDRSVSSIGFFDSESQVLLDVSTYQHYLYSAYSMKFDSQWTLSIAGRFNDSEISMFDRIEVGEGSLNGKHDFNRFNSAIGLQHQLNERWTATLSYSEGSRVPSPAELSCADENDPCKLPNGFVADPPLEKVVAKTLEGSIRYATTANTIIATIYNTRSLDDIIFQQAGASQSQGYFINVDETKRQGVELSLEHNADSFTVGGSYSYLNATFESSFISFSPNNPLGSNRLVQAGDSIPGQPEHQLKMHATWQINDDVSSGVEWLFASSSYYRGDEANENKKVPSYALANIYANYQINQTTTVSARVNNIFDRQYHTFGTYGETEDVLGEFYPQITSAYFVGPSSPRAISIDLYFQF